MLNIKKTLTKVLDALKCDYIVEQGTDGIWTYRKWNSGIAECWGEYSYSVTTSSVWASPIYITTSCPRQNYPFTFVSAPMEWASGMTGANACWLYSESTGFNTTTKTAEYRPIKVNTFGSTTVKVRYFVSGKWK